jgi:hypothetical protein
MDPAPIATTTSAISSLLVNPEGRKEGRTEGRTEGRMEGRKGGKD